MAGHYTKRGFTIVELLIVIVVIAILAAITIVAFNGVQNRAKDASVQADVSNAIKKLETLKLQSTSEQYPASLAGTGIFASTGNTLTYSYSSTDNSYCIQGVNGTFEWAASSSRPSVVTGSCGKDSLTGQWLFNGDATDSSGNGTTGTFANASLTTGKNGLTDNAYLFSGTASYMNFGTSALYNQPEVTMSAWVRTNTTAGSQTIMAKEGKYKYRFNTGAVQVLASTATSWTHSPSCSFAYATATWYHVVMTLSSTSGRIKVYVNGNQICDNPGPVVTSYPANPLMVGSYNTGGSEAFNGTIDDARFYSRALSGGEVKGLYDADAR